MNKKEKKFDVVVIGGGPAGMLAAGRAAEMGAKVVLLERNRSLGNKLLMTGHGRCNLTNAEFDDKKFVQKLNDKKAKFLFSSLAQFGPEAVVEFFAQRGLATQIENNERVFPKTGKASDVLHILQKYLKENKVEIITEADVVSLETIDGKIESVKLANKKIYGDKFMLCTGGKSYPNTGSTGSGYALVKSLGHKIIKPVPALVPIKTKEGWVKNLQGLSLKSAKIAIIQNNKKQSELIGDILFTHFGLSGPVILNASKLIGKLLTLGEVKLQIDLLSDLSGDQLEEKLKKDFAKMMNKDLKNYLSDLVSEKLSELIIGLSGIESKKKLNFVTKEERQKIGKRLKGLELTVDGLLGYNQAMITSGGVALQEIDSKTMQSKIVKNLYFAGEILDLDGPTGGFNLQICWSTGYAAGTAAI